MGRMLVIVSLVVACVSVWVAAIALLQTQSAHNIMPTLAVLPKRFPTDTARATLAPSLTFTLSATFTATQTPTFTPTPTPTVTSTLTTRLLQIHAIMPGVMIVPTLTPFPEGTVLLPSPPEPVEPLPDATHEAPPYEGWYSFESDHPAVSYAPMWEARLNTLASRGQYHRSENVQAIARFTFEGEGLRIRYVAAPNMGIFQVMVDGIVIDTIDCYTPEIAFIGTKVYFVGSGSHTLELRNAQQKNAASEGFVGGLDAIQVFRGNAQTLILPPMPSLPTLTPNFITDIQLVSAPAMVQATPTPLAPAELNVSVVIAYDENGNNAVDPAEGVSGIPVRVVEIGTNRVIANTVTDAQGFAFMELISANLSRVVVPYFGKVWALQGGQRNAHSTFTLLLTPGNQPGLIP